MKKFTCLYKLLIGVMAIFLMACSSTDKNTSYLIYPDNNQFIVQGQLDGKAVLKENEASEAINFAINRLAEKGGGEIKLAAGLFNIDKPIILKNFIALKGSGKSTILKLSDKNKESIVIFAKDVDNVEVADMTLQGLPFTPREVKAVDTTVAKKYGKHKEEKFDPSKEIVYPNDPTGIVFHQVGTSIISKVYARDFAGYGIWLRKDNFMNEVSSCVTSANGKAGIYLSHNNVGGRGGHAVPNIISNCKSYSDYGHAYELRRSTCNNFVGCVVYQCKGHGFYFHDHSCSNLISGCRVFEGYKNGVYCHWAPETNITGNIFCWNNGNGIEFNNVVWGTISGNNVIDNGGVIKYDSIGIKGIAYGIYLHTDTRSIQVTGNAVFNWGDGHGAMIHGIYETENCMNNNVVGNNVNFYEGKAVSVNGKNSVEANNLGRAKFYSKPWEGPFMPDEDLPTQLLETFNSKVAEDVLRNTRR